MAKGAIAKEKVIKIISDAFGTNYIGEHDKKIYVQAEENGEMVQVALTLTCPKNPIGGVVEKVNLLETDVVEVKMTQEEEKNIADLMARLGL